jgi:hypothetical protein
MGVAAGAMRGALGVALTGHLREFAAADLRDIEALSARLVMIGGQPPTTAAERSNARSTGAILRRLVREEQEAIDALVGAIPADADDAEGEATEHLLEHIIYRKRQALELLQRALAEGTEKG